MFFLNNLNRGTLIHLLVDEFREIRINCLIAIREFSQKSQDFAEKVRVILFQILNDDDDLVRLEAFTTISKIVG